MNSEEDWAVRADRLQAAGDPWGQRIALWMANAKATDAVEHNRLIQALADLDAAHGEHLYGPELRALMTEDGFPMDKLHWEYGYIVGASLMMPKQGGFGRLRMADIVQALVRSPATEFLRYLSVRTRGLEMNCLRDAIAAASAGHPLRALEYLGLGPDSQEQVKQAALGDLSPLWPITPKLHKLWLRGCDIAFGRFAHPTLEQLDLETTELPAASVRSLALAELPELRRMTAALGLSAAGNTEVIDILRPLFESTTLPKLEHLGLRISWRQDEVAIALARSALLAQLRSVDLSGGRISGPGARALIANAERFQHLESLELRFDDIPEPLQEALRRAIPVVDLAAQTHLRMIRRDIPQDP